MGMEIERKFLTKDNAYRALAKGELYKQGYIGKDPTKVVRIRIANNKGYITIKGVNSGAVRKEYEYEIPLSDADEMIECLCEKPVIEKYRYKVHYKGFVWEIDEFSGENEGLVVAEIELQDGEQEFEIPDWIGEEVTNDIRYYNSNLIKNPYSKWNTV